MDKMIWCAAPFQKKSDNKGGVPAVLLSKPIILLQNEYQFFV